MARARKSGGLDNYGRPETYVQHDTYEGVCYELGFDAGVHFVKITTAGTISFACGKPQEIRVLYRAVVNAGYVPSAALKEAAAH